MDGFKMDALAEVLHAEVQGRLALRPLETRTAAPAEARGGPGRPRWLKQLPELRRKFDVGMQIVEALKTTKAQRAQNGFRRRVLW
jgi:hypothetical protein